MVLVVFVIFLLFIVLEETGLSRRPILYNLIHESHVGSADRHCWDELANILSDGAQALLWLTQFLTIFTIMTTVWGRGARRGGLIWIWLLLLLLVALIFICFQKALTLVVPLSIGSNKLYANIFLLIVKRWSHKVLRCFFSLTLWCELSIQYRRSSVGFELRDLPCWQFESTHLHLGSLSNLTWRGAILSLHSNPLVWTFFQGN